MSSNIQFIIGLLFIPATLAVIWYMHHWLTIEVKEYQSVILTSFGQWKKQWDVSGEFLELSKILPWVKTEVVSKKIQSELLSDISLHDQNGTSLLADVWIEFSIHDPKKVLFAVEDWKDAMKSLFLQATTGTLSGLKFNEILKNRSSLETTIKEDAKNDLTRWGITLHRVMIQNLSLLPEVNRQILQGVAAHLERKKALIEEEAKMNALAIESKTTLEIAVLKGEAASQMALALGRSIESLKKNPDVYQAYQQLYRLSLSKPDQMVVFEGFKDGLKTTDTALFLKPNE
jgi:regulator of protease activity HflC (stomatin/prohibitin superfamily)